MLEIEVLEGWNFFKFLIFLLVLFNHCIAWFSTISFIANIWHLANFLNMISVIQENFLCLPLNVLLYISMHSFESERHGLEFQPQAVGLTPWPQFPHQRNGENIIYLAYLLWWFHIIFRKKCTRHIVIETKSFHFSSAKADSENCFC